MIRESRLRARGICGSRRNITPGDRDGRFTGFLHGDAGQPIADGSGGRTSATNRGGCECPVCPAGGAGGVSRSVSIGGGSGQCVACSAGPGGHDARGCPRRRPSHHVSDGPAAARGRGYRVGKSADHSKNRSRVDPRGSRGDAPRRSSRGQALRPPGGQATGVHRGHAGPHPGRARRPHGSVIRPHGPHRCRQRGGSGRRHRAGRSLRGDRGRHDLRRGTDLAGRVSPLHRSHRGAGPGQHHRVRSHAALHAGGTRLGGRPYGAVPADRFPRDECRS